MTHPAITVERLSKAYRIGLKDEVHDTLVGAFTGMLKAPWKNWRKLSRLNTFRNQDDAEDMFWALRDVSFEVAEGEVVGIIGHNGAGKSTLLKILSRITEPTSGRAVIRGRVSSLLEVGTGFHPELSGRENIYMNGTILGMTKREIDRKFDEIVDFSGVEKFLDTPIKHYSSGMKVRLAFSVAAHLEPDILIIDEVLAVGDVAFQKKCIGKMGEVARGGRTVLFVSHNMAALEALCSRGLALHQGCLELDSPMKQVLDHHRRTSFPNVDDKNAEVFAAANFFADFNLLDEHGEPTSVISLGRELHLEMLVAPPHPVNYPRFHIGIDDAIGHRLLTLATPASHEAVGPILGPTKVRCRVPSLPLAPGTHSVTLVLFENRERLERLERCASFTVINGDAFGEGRGHIAGTCVAASQWSAQPAAAEQPLQRA